MGETVSARYGAPAALLLLALAVTPSARATLVAQDLFLTGNNPALGQYTNGVNIAGQNPIIAGFTGPWIVATSGNSLINSTSLNYPDPLFPAETGGSYAASGSNSRVGRLFDASNPFNNSGTVYLSFVMQLTGYSTSANSYQAIDLYGGGFTDASQRVFQLGQSAYGDFNNSTVFGFRINNDSTQVGSLGALDANVHLFLVKFNLSTTPLGDSVTVWKDPSLTNLSTDPAGGVTLTGFDLRSVDRLALAEFTTATAGTTAVDEFRIGTTLSNVLMQLVITIPVATNSPATGIQANTAILGGQVVSTGNQTPSVTLYYGTADGGTNAGAWANSLALGLETGNFSVGVTGLAPGTTYYFTAAATNSAGQAWAMPSFSFTTATVRQPVVSNAPAVNIQANTATLAGQVVSTGNQAPDVTVYYGTIDGGTNPAAWAYNVDLGAQSAGFAVTVAGLTTNAAYYFTASASNQAGRAWATPSQTFTTLSSLVPQPILTYHYDNTRAGANTHETILTPANVNTNNFGKLFTYVVDGFVYAQALVATNVTIPGKGTHNLLFVETTHDTVYAFDADTYVPTPYWTNSFINPAAGIVPAPSADTSISPGSETGITATPVIDPATGTIYIEARTKEIIGGVTSYPHRLHALDISTGQEKAAYNSPVLISVTNYPGTGTSGQNDTDGAGHVLWNGLREHCRPALLLANGMVYITYASPGDHAPYYGWVFSYDAHTLAQTGVFNSAPNTGYSGVWMNGDGPLADTNGFIYLNTGNGTFNTNQNAYGDSILKLNGTNGLHLADYFAPYNTSALASGDWDVSSAGMCLLPSVNGTNLLLSGSKLGTLYVLDCKNLGGWTNNSANPNAVQSLNGPLTVLWGSPAYFNGMVYIQPCGGQFSGSDTLKSFALSGLTLNPTPTAQAPTAFGYPGGTPAVSANGTLNGIVWEIQTDGFSSGGQAILHAFNATNVAQELYNSSQIPTRDNPGVAVLYTLPAVANGKVYVGGQFAMSVFGNNIFLALPTITPNGGIFTNSVTVTLADATPGTTLYYTLDGSTPDTNAIRYTGPFNLTNSAAVSIIAVKPGSVNTPAVIAGFFNSSAVGNGTGLTGAYYTNHTSASPYTGSPTLVRTDATVNFNWSSVGPDPSIGQTNYTVRWTGCVQPQFDETFTFYATADDGVRLWVNGQELVNGWVDQGSTTYQGSITLKAQQLYNIGMDYYQNGGGAVAQLAWSSPSTLQAIIPQSQLYPFTNPPPGVVLNSPANNSTYTASASVTLSATALAQYNDIDNVAFYANSTYLGSVSNLPYSLTVTGLSAGGYSLTAVATDGSGLSSTSAPVNITVNSGTGQPYGLTARPPAPAFFNMPSTYTGTLPPLLSQTGVFSNTPAMIPTNALIPYIPNTPLWSDNAVKTRWMSVPYAGGLETSDQQIGFASTGEWSFPVGTVFVKHFALATDQTNPNAPLRRLETRLLVRDINGAVYGVTYKWRADNSDADLLTNGLSEAILITNVTGISTQTWYYPSPADCLSCHTAAANYVLGVKTAQLNGNFTYPSSGITDNQLRTLNQLGIFTPSFDEAQIPTYPQMVAVTNLSASLTNRFRSYLDANCSQCHRPGGTGHANFDARYDTPLSSQGIINGVVSANLGYDNAYVVAPDDVWRSILYDRMNTVDASIKMPPLARNLVDSNAVAAVAAFINGLSGTPALAPPTLSPGSGAFTGFVSITAGATAPIYYTLDGSLPTTNSLLYTGPIVLTNSAVVSASAFQTGYVNSVAATGTFTILPLLLTAPDMFTNGVFQLQLSATPNRAYILQASTNLTQWVTIATNTPLTTPFSLTDPGSTNFLHRFYRVLLQQP